ncbi:hypothetical protein BpHYR1_034137 [Brachionus plicatilis]|uniref:Uncharacterized protein n=1 Tax=Brachionus plicatilis TaxID=10195 RepID=A0A3M7S6R1_BRAPC|nr:hypothetical protein BpHYR1_034137 [Brachionus plicatilis]
MADSGSSKKRNSQVVRYEETGSVSDRSRSGRPRKLTLRDENYIFREIRKDLTSSYQKFVTDFNSKTQAVRIRKSSFLTARKGKERKLINLQNVSKKANYFKRVCEESFNFIFFRILLHSSNDPTPIIIPIFL